MSNNKYKVLIIDDEANIRSFMGAILESNGYQVLTAATCAQGKMMFSSHCPDLVLLDLGLPDADGTDFIRTVRAAGGAAPILVLSARSDERDKVQALDLGANDYITKPFGTGELLARVRALGRRPTEWEGGAALHRGDVELRVQDRLLTGPAGAHTLSRRECALLELFLRNPGTTLPRERILLNVWGPDSDVESGNIDNYIHLVRRRLRLVGSRMELTTRRGAGYCLEADKC